MLIVLSFFMTFMSSVYLLLGCSNGLACVSACVSVMLVYILWVNAERLCTCLEAGVLASALR